MWTYKNGNKRESRSIIAEGRFYLESRPATGQFRKHIGDIDVDLMMGKNTVSKSILHILHKATYTVHTLTFDNDKAFAETGR